MSDFRGIDALAGKQWDTVVIGAGPAGSIAAIELAKRGHPVLLVERAHMPRYKVCGGCLNARALSILAEMGLDDVVWRAGGARLAGFVLAGGGKTAEVELPDGAAISRAALDAGIVQAARDAGVAVVEGYPAAIESADDAGVAVRLGRGNESAIARARVCVVASGLASDAMRAVPEIQAEIEPNARIGAGACFECADAFYDTGKIYMAVARGGYVGMVRVENNGLNIAAAFDVRHVRECGAPPEAAARVLEAAGLPVPSGLAAADWRGTPPLTRRARTVAARRVVLVGDAAGYIEPFTGEGMAWASESGRAAADLIHRSLDVWDDSVCAAWQSTYDRVFAAAQRRCRMIAGMLRRPAAVASAVTVLRALPMLARPLVKSLNTPYRAEEVVP